METKKKNVRGVYQRESGKFKPIEKKAIHDKQRHRKEAGKPKKSQKAR